MYPVTALAYKNNLTKQMEYDIKCIIKRLVIKVNVSYKRYIHKNFLSTLSILYRPIYRQLVHKNRYSSVRRPVVIQNHPEDNNLPIIAQWLPYPFFL